MAENLSEFAVDLLESDPNGMGRTKLQEELVDMQTTLKRTLDAGVSPDDAKVIEALGKSVDAARTAVDGIWKRNND